MSRLSQASRFPQPSAHLALQVARVVLVNHAANGRRDEHIAGHGEDGLFGDDHAARKRGQAAQGKGGTEGRVQGMRAAKRGGCKG